MSAPLPWHDHTTLLGVGVRVYFFNPLVADAQTEPALRCLPILMPVLMTSPQALPLPQPWHAPSAEPALYSAGALQAQPDAVLAHGEGLLSVLQRGGDGRLHEPAHWRTRLQADMVLQAVATAMAVAGHSQLPTVALWRARNALYQLDASLPVLQCLAAQLPAACRYWGQAAGVTAAQLARFCEPRLRALASGEPRNSAEAAIPA